LVHGPIPTLQVALRAAVSGPVCRAGRREGIGHRGRPALPPESEGQHRRSRYVEPGNRIEVVQLPRVRLVWSVVTLTVWPSVTKVGTAESASSRKWVSSYSRTVENAGPYLGFCAP